ncbi:CCHC-type domain-containing protein [Nephila pilipes]|uniref:CCHC-type domain-containing protein n=1 Tax=Nephila pilipes TaxID=299642 RepID=A0A8X6PMD6_NEPPI|nr:CCHC-type domain-containing protein [Nephila pilipes]
MEKPKPCSELLLERTVDREVFADMDDFALVNDSSRYALSLRLQFPKFSKGFNPSFFEEFVQEHVGEDNLVSIGRMNFPNEWQMEVSSKEVREKLIRWGKTKIKNRSCWIYPLGTSEIRGFVHWLPNTVQNQKLKEFLSKYGEVLFVESQKQNLWSGKVSSDSRYYALYLRAGQSMDDLPHFYEFDNFLALITVRGRNPACFHCKEIGHRKNECKKFKVKLSSYCERPKHSATARNGPRGKRFKASISGCNGVEKGQDTSDLIAEQLSNIELDSNTSDLITEQSSNIELDSNTSHKKARKRRRRSGKKAAKAENVKTETEVMEGKNECVGKKNATKSEKEVKDNVEELKKKGKVEKEFKLQLGIGQIDKWMTKANFMAKKMSALGIEVVDKVPIGQTAPAVEGAKKKRRKNKKNKSGSTQ